MADRGVALVVARTGFPYFIGVEAIAVLLEGVLIRIALTRLRSTTPLPATPYRASTPDNASAVR